MFLLRPQCLSNNIYSLLLAKLIHSKINLKLSPLAPKFFTGLAKCKLITTERETTEKQKYLQISDLNSLLIQKSLGLREMSFTFPDLSAGKRSKSKHYVQEGENETIRIFLSNFKKADIGDKPF